MAALSYAATVPIIYQLVVRVASLSALQPNTIIIADLTGVVSFLHSRLWSSVRLLSIREIERRAESNLLSAWKAKVLPSYKRRIQASLASL